MNTHKKLSMVRVLKDLIPLLLATGWLIGVPSLPLAWASDAMPGVPFSLHDVETWETMPNRTMIVRVGGKEYLFSVEKSTHASDCGSIRIEKDKVVWLTHIGYMPHRYFTSTTPIMIRTVGAEEWDSFVGKTWGPQCEEANCKESKDKK